MSDALDRKIDVINEQSEDFHKRSLILMGPHNDVGDLLYLRTNTAIGIAEAIVSNPGCNIGVQDIVTTAIQITDVLLDQLAVTYTVKFAPPTEPPAE